MYSKDNFFLLLNIFPLYAPETIKLYTQICTLVYKYTTMFTKNVDETTIDYEKQVVGYQPTNT